MKNSISNTQEVNETLKEISDQQAKVDKINRKAEEKIQKIRDKAKQKTAPLESEINQKEKQLLDYTKMYRNELFEDKKSRDFPYGTIGYRQSTKVKIDKKETLGLLKKYGLNEAIKVKESVLKSVVKRYDKKVLDKIKAEVVTNDNYYVKVN